MDQKASEIFNDLYDFRLKRTFPLVPEPFGPLRFMWSNLLLPYGPCLGKYNCSYLPELDAKKYYLSKAEEDQMEITARARILSKHAQENSYNKVSEYTWEADLRADLFAKMRNDPRLRM